MSLIRTAFVGAILAFGGLSAGCANIGASQSDLVSDSPRALNSLYIEKAAARAISQNAVSDTHLTLLMNKSVKLSVRAPTLQKQKTQTDRSN